MCWTFHISFAKVGSFSHCRQCSNSILDHSIQHPRCSHFIAVEIWDKLWCNEDKSIKTKSPQTFRFIHHEMHTDSEEFHILRRLLRRAGHIECMAGEPSLISSGEDFVWVLGHLAGNGVGVVDALAPPSTPNTFRLNNFPNATHLGDKDVMGFHLKALAREFGDEVVDFVPRTWQATEFAQALHELESQPESLWILKDPRKGKAAPLLSFLLFLILS